MPHVAVTFGSLPIGAMFTVSEKQRRIADRRTFEYVRVTYHKRSHGSEAGFASRGIVGTLVTDRRFSHYEGVQVDASDLRLLVTIAQASEVQP